MNKKTIYESVKMNFETGEIQESQRIIKKTVTQEKFRRTYVADICKLAKCTGAEQSIILASLQFVDYETNELMINTGRRKIIAATANIKDSTFNVNLGRLIAKNIIVKIDNILYLNPRLFFYGSDIGREKVLNLTLKYEMV